MEDRILELLKEIPEREIPEEFEKTLSFSLKQEAWAMRRRRRTRAFAAVAASFLVVFGSISVYNDFGGFKGGDSYDSAGFELYSEDDMAYVADGGADGGVSGSADDMAKGRAGDVNESAELREASQEIGIEYGTGDSEYLALLDELLGGKDYYIKEVSEQENGDWVFYVLHKGKERVFIGRSGEIHEQEGEEQQADSD